MSTDNATTLSIDQPHTMKQPPVFWLSVCTALFERCGYYVLAYFMVLYTKSEFHYPDVYAYALYGVLNAFVYLTPAIGGYLADNIIGIRRSMYLGIILEGIGLTILAFPYQDLFLLGSATVIIGVGFFKTGPTDLLGRGYEEHDPRIDSGFTWYYMAMNIGSFISPLAVGILHQKFSWEVSFLFGAGALYLNLLILTILSKRAKGCESKAGRAKLPLKRYPLIAIGVILATIITVLFLKYSDAAYVFFFIATVAIFAYFSFEIIRSPKDEKMRIIACLALIIIGLFFFILYFQQFMSITLFIKRCVSHPTIFGYKITTGFFLTLNPFWIIVLSPILITAYNKLAKKGKDLCITTKFWLGVLIISLCFFILKISTVFPNSHYKVASYWVVIALMLYSLGELLISALGVAMVTHIAPKRMYGVMMGAWYLIAAALASSISSSVASLAAIRGWNGPLQTLDIYGNAFFEMAVIGLIAALIAFVVSPYIKKIAQLEEEPVT